MERVKFSWFYCVDFLGMKVFIFERILNTFSNKLIISEYTVFVKKCLLNSIYQVFNKIDNDLKLHFPCDSMEKNQQNDQSKRSTDMEFFFQGRYRLLFAVQGDDDNWSQYSFIEKNVKFSLNNLNNKHLMFI